MTRRLGLFGGTFDPPHVGHVRVLETARATGWFDELVVTVAGDPWQKSANRTLQPAAWRFALATAAFGEMAGVTVSDRELRRGGPTFTVDTVRELVARGDEVTLIVGEDAAEGLDTWHEAEELARLVRVAVVPRGGRRVSVPKPWRVRRLEMEPVDLSSTTLRDQGLREPSAREFLPAALVPLLAQSPR